MKKFVLDFVLRGCIAFGFGPIVLAVVYLILSARGVVDTLSVTEVCVGVLSISVLAFVVGGMNAIYKVERLRLSLAILIHGCVLYATYLVTYLINDWLTFGVTPVLVFSIIFVAGYIAIWGIIYFSTKIKTARINKILKTLDLDE